MARFHAINDAYIVEVGDRSGSGLQIAVKMDCLVELGDEFLADITPPAASNQTSNFLQMVSKGTV